MADQALGSSVNAAPEALLEEVTLGISHLALATPLGDVAARAGAAAASPSASKAPFSLARFVEALKQGSVRRELNFDLHSDSPPSPGGAAALHADQSPRLHRALALSLLCAPRLASTALAAAAASLDALKDAPCEAPATRVSPPGFPVPICPVASQSQAATPPLDCAPWAPLSQV